LKDAFNKKGKSEDVVSKMPTAAVKPSTAKADTSKVGGKGMVTKVVTTRIMDSIVSGILHNKKKASEIESAAPPRRSTVTSSAVK